MWGRHYWGGGRRPSGAGAGAGGGGGGRGEVGGVVVMFAWLSSQERHVRAYVELYAALGWACLVCHSDFLTLFFPEKAAVLANGKIAIIGQQTMRFAIIGLQTSTSTPTRCVIRCVITADEVLLLNSLDSYVLQYAAELQRRLLQRAEGDELPFEFRALELALEAACSFLDAQELKVRPVPVVFASFSGGPKGCTYKVLQLLERRCEGQLSLDEYHLVRDCLCGQMYDSSPVDFVSDLGTRFLLHPSVLKMSQPPRVLTWMTKGIASGLDTLFFGKFEAQRKEYWETLYSSVHVGPVLIFCSEDDELAPCSIVQNFAQRLLQLGGDVNLVKWHSSPHVGHYKHHPEEYRAAVTELLIKASTLYMSTRQLNGCEVGSSEHSGMPQSICNLHKSAASSNDRLRRVPTDLADHFFLPSSMEYHESSNEGPKPELFNMPSVESMNPHGVLGQMLYDVCVPNNVEGWDFKPSASINGKKHIHTIARRHGTFNPIKCIRRSRL